MPSKRLALIVTASALSLMVVAVLSGCVNERGSQTGQVVCETRISEFELRHELAKDPAFARGVPPPGKVMQIEPWGCGYRVSIGNKSPDEFNATDLLTDANGHVIEVVQGY